MVQEKTSRPQDSAPMTSDRYLFDGICDRRPVVPAQAAEDHGAEGGPDGESAARPHQSQAGAVRGPPALTRINFRTIFP
jgi:hypothetical protein